MTKGDKLVIGVCLAWTIVAVILGIVFQDLDGFYIMMRTPCGIMLGCAIIVIFVERKNE